MSPRSASTLLVALVASCVGSHQTPPPVPPAESVLVTAAVLAHAKADGIAVRLDVLDVEGVKVAAYAASLPSGADAWTFVTAGRASTGRPELVVSFARRDGEELAAATADARALLKAAMTVAAGPSSPDWTAWSARAIEVAPLGRDDMVGAAAVPARAPDGVSVPPGSLALIPLTHDELAIAAMHGVPRVATMLARAYRVHPAPWWIDRDRAAVATAEEHEREAWGTTSGTFQPGITAFLDITGEPVLIPKPPGAWGGWQLEGTWRLRVTREGADRLADHLEDLSPRWPTAIAIAPDELSGATFAWVPAGRGPQLARGTSATSRPAVVLLAFFAKERRTGAELVDDGLFISISKEQRAALVSALRDGTAVELEPADGMMRWRLEWTR